MKGKPTMRFSYKSFSASMILLLASSSLALAQGIAPGSVDVAGTVGYAHVDGVTSKNHFTFGPAAVYNLNPEVAVGGEYSYTPLGSETLFGATGSEHLQLFGPVARFSFTQSSRAVPYVVVAGGAVDEYAAVTYEGLKVAASQKGYYFAFGGGVSLFAGAGWGIRPEFRYARQHFNETNIDGTLFESFGQNDIQATVSIFRQFGGR
jgi:hypothetical protein